MNAVMMAQRNKGAYARFAQQCETRRLNHTHWGDIESMMFRYEDLARAEYRDALMMIRRGERAQALWYLRRAMRYRYAAQAYIEQMRRAYNDERAFVPFTHRIAQEHLKLRNLLKP